MTWVLGKSGTLVDFSTLPPQEPHPWRDGWITAWCRSCNQARWALDPASHVPFPSELVCSTHWEPYLIMWDDAVVDDKQTFL